MKEGTCPPPSMDNAQTLLEWSYDVPQCYSPEEGCLVLLLEACAGEIWNWSTVLPLVLLVHRVSSWFTR